VIEKNGRRKHIVQTPLKGQGDGDDDDELDGPAVSALSRAIVEVKQRWSVIG
jgi:hypothetical protein